MRPLGTQRPERPKSELWHNKYEKCGLSKAPRLGGDRNPLPLGTLIADRWPNRAQQPWLPPRFSPGHCRRTSDRGNVVWSVTIHEPKGDSMSTVTSDARTVPAGEPTPIIRPL